MGKALPTSNITNKEAEKILDEVVGYYPWSQFDSVHTPPKWRPFKEKVIEAMEKYHEEKLKNDTRRSNS